MRTLLEPASHSKTDATQQQKGTPGWRGGAVGRSAFHRASQPESDAWDPQDEGENPCLQAVPSTCVM